MFCRSLLLLVLICPLAPADELLLVSGGRLSCEVLEETESVVTVRLPNGTMQIPRSRIAGIRRESSDDYLRREARRSHAQGMTASAVELYRKALDLDPGDAETRRGYADALLARAQDLLEQYRLDEADAVLRTLEEISKGGGAGAAGLREKIRREEVLGGKLRQLGQEAIEKGDYERAIAYLDAWRVRRPVGDEQAKRDLARAHLLAAKAALHKSRARAALDHYRTAASFGEHEVSDEALRLLRPIAVLEELKEGDLPTARRIADSIGARYPDPAVPVFLQALIHHVSGEVKLAVAGYADAARLATASEEERRGGLTYEVVRAYAASTLRSAIMHPPQAGVERWRDTFIAPLRKDETGRYFTIYASTEAEAQRIGGLAEAAYERISRELLGEVPDARRAEIVVHPGREAYVAADPVPRGSPLASVTVRREQTSGVCLATLDEQGKPLIRVEVFSGNSTLDEDTLPHELVHVVQRHGLPVHRRGHWLDEGLAMLYESEGGRRTRIEALRRGGEVMALTNLLALRSNPPDDALLFYNQSYALVEYLRDLKGESGWRSFLEHFADGDFENAIRQAYDIESLDLLERQWLAHYRLSRS